jgi:hypothetical protein
LGQNAGIGVVAGAMIAVDKCDPSGLRKRAICGSLAGSQRMFGAMGEGKRPWLKAEGAKDGVVGNPTKRDDHVKLWQSRNRCHKKSPAAIDFRWQRLVLRRHAAHGIGDQAGSEAQAIAGRSPISASGKAKFEQRLIEKLAREIAGKGTTGAIRASQAGRKANDQETRIIGSERGNGGIVPIWLSRAEAVAKSREARAIWTIRVRLWS